MLKKPCVTWMEHPSMVIESKWHSQGLVRGLHVRVVQEVVDTWKICAAMLALGGGTLLVTVQIPCVIDHLVAQATETDVKEKSFSFYSTGIDVFFPSLYLSIFHLTVFLLSIVFSFCNKFCTTILIDNIDMKNL
uniref:Uncharacterized protein n=1 Tax=Cacopsylla melanoneura TaxID=428564 RepID=A0A8D9FCH6_9HEMI